MIHARGLARTYRTRRAASDAVRGVDLDVVAVFRRAMRFALRNAVWTVMGLAQPILYLVLFGPLLKPIAAAVGAQNPYQLFVPGLLVQLGMFGALFVGFGLIGEWRDGVIEAERVTPCLLYTSPSPRDRQ